MELDPLDAPAVPVGELVELAVVGEVEPVPGYVPEGGVVAAPAVGLGTAACGSETEGTCFGVAGDEPEPGYVPVGPPVEVPPLGLGAAAWLSVSEGTCFAVAGDEPLPGYVPVGPLEDVPPLGLGAAASSSEGTAGRG